MSNLFTLSIAALLITACQGSYNGGANRNNLAGTPDRAIAGHSTHVTTDVVATTGAASQIANQASNNSGAY